MINQVASVPHFVGIGAQKAATSWIHACLYEHPQAYLPATKELHYFSREYERGAHWYLEHFAAARPGQIAGEISPTYLYDPEAPARIHRWNSRMKLIACLRNPIERAISAYAYGVKQGNDWNGEKLADLVQRKPRILAQGLYYEQLERYFDLFDRDNVLVLLYDDISANPLAFVQRIFRHLGMDASYVPPSTAKRVNVSLGAPRVSAYHSALRGGANALRTLGFEKLVWRVARSRFGEVLTASNRAVAVRPQLTASERARLSAFYEDDVAALGRLIGRDVSSVWLKSPAA